MKRNLLIGVVGVVLGLLLLYAGGWLTYQMMMQDNHSGAEWKGDLIGLFIVRELVMLPVIAAAVGIFIGWNVRCRAWWVAPLSLLPTIIVFSGYSFQHGADVLLTIIYLLIALTGATATWYLRKGKRAVSKAHV